jgi:hypothetical protein
MGFRKKNRNAMKANWKVEKVGRDAAKIKRAAKGKTAGQKLADKMTARG